MHILVGTLYSGENEFEQCVAAIKRQTVPCDHFVIENLPNKQAHEALYQRFMDQAARYDLFIKVDADMVLENRSMFSLMAARFDLHPELKDLEVAVLDCFSDRLIWGMHAYRSTVTWERDNEDLFVDYKTFRRGEHMKDDNDLAPAALHCPDPSPFQAFHFGVHMALKAIQPGRVVLNRVASEDHWKTIEMTRAKFWRTRDTKVGLAVLGAEIGFQGSLRPADLDYSAKRLRDMAEQYEHLDAKGLEHAIRSVSWRSFGFLGSARRYEPLMKVHRLRAHAARGYARHGPLKFLPWAVGKTLRRLVAR